jgi:hypothetical protein
VVCSPTDSWASQDFVRLDQAGRGRRAKQGDHLQAASQPRHRDVIVDGRVWAAWQGRSSCESCPGLAGRPLPRLPRPCPENRSFPTASRPPVRRVRCGGVDTAHGAVQWASCLLQLPGRLSRTPVRRQERELSISTEPQHAFLAPCVCSPTASCRDPAPFHCCSRAGRRVDFSWFPPDGVLLFPLTGQHKPPSQAGPAAHPRPRRKYKCQKRARGFSPWSSTEPSSMTSFSAKD